MGRVLRILGQQRPSSANAEGTGVCVISGHSQGEAEPVLLLEDDSRKVTLWGRGTTASSAFTEQQAPH